MRENDVLVEASLSNLLECGFEVKENGKPGEAELCG